ncbi:MAG TPA: SAM-dependent methyltransferase, partial [Rhodanobacteraceae bacterium]
MTEASHIRNVSDTARWVAIYRAMESERPDALFRDPYARKLAGERGEAIVRTMPGGVATAWPMIVRTAVMDEIILRCIDAGAATVLNLAAGLDTRPYRLDLPKSLRWLHVDMPDMLGHFREQMADATPRCNVEFIAADLRDANTRREVCLQAAAPAPILVITEGLLVYLSPDDVAALARDLHDMARARWWLIDIATPLLRKFMQRRGMLERLQQANAPMQFFPEQGTGFFKPFGWKEKEFHST